MIKFPEEKVPEIQRSFRFDIGDDRDRALRMIKLSEEKVPDIQKGFRFDIGDDQLPRKKSV